MFKQIQIYMTDRENRNKTTEEVGLEIVRRGYSEPALRDEIYCQIIKQLTNNVKTQSVNRGSSLLLIALYVFSPSRELENYLEVFIRNQPRERRERLLVALQSILYSASGGMKRAPTMKDMQDIIGGIRPVKRDFLDEAPEVPAWAPLTVPFSEMGDDSEEYFESAHEPLAGSVAPRPKETNNKPKRKTVGKRGAPNELPSTAKFNFGQNLKESANAPPMNPVQQKQQKKGPQKMQKQWPPVNPAQNQMNAPPMNPVQQKQQKQKQQSQQQPQRKTQQQQQSRAMAVREEKMAESAQSEGDYEWLCHLDAESGDVFYERISDGQTTWDRPSAGKVKPHWLAHKDLESGELYFENIDSGETQWERPEEFSDPDEKWIARRDPDSGDFYYENIETQKTQWDPPKCFEERVAEDNGQKGWMRHFDPTSGEYYYENLKTGQTTWDQPPDVKF